MQLAETSAAVAALSNGRGSAGITICIVHASNHHDLTAHSSCRLAEVATKMGRRRVAHSQRLSISAIISSAQRTASAIALTVAGMRVPPYAAETRAGRHRPHSRHWQALAQLAGCFFGRVKRASPRVSQLAEQPTLLHLSQNAGKHMQQENRCQHSRSVFSCRHGLKVLL
jgi:hypothetical protein